MAPLISKFKLPRNPYLIFLPFLLLYILIVLLFQSTVLWGDEDRYLMYAQNLVQGSYAGSGLNLSSGPGYPIILMPFVAIHISLIVIKLLNPFFYYLAVIFLFKSLQRFVSFKIALIVSLFFACYYNAYENLPLILTETFTIFLISALLFCLTKVFTGGASKKYIYWSGFLFGYIALTKVIFGYVMLLMLIGYLLLWVLKRRNENYKKSLAILAIALITTAPYLIYTYNLTGRVFYWSTASGNNLYWMSSPYKNEFGNWSGEPKTTAGSSPSSDTIQNMYLGGEMALRVRKTLVKGFEDSIKAKHGKDFEKINSYKTEVEKDDAFRKIAISNIRSHPLKFMENWVCNVGRIIFNYPYSYKLQRPVTLFRLPMNGIIVVLILFCIIPAVKNWRKIDFLVKFLLWFIFLYFGGSSLGSAETRMFTVAIPVLLLCIAFILSRTVTFTMKFSNDQQA